MIYRPSGKRFLWDTWLYRHREEFHLFFLESATRDGLWNHIGHAISSNLLQWRELPSIPVPPGDADAWDNQTTLTGTIVQGQGRHWMFFGATGQGVQRIGLMESTDLLTWKPFDKNPVLTPGEPYYAAVPDAHGNGVPWRDPCVNWRDDWQAYEAMVCARLPAWGEHDSGACIARCRSRDLIHWQRLAPAAHLGAHFLEGEVPDYFELNGRHYLLFSSQDGFGIRLNTAGRRRATGIYYVIALQRDGEYRLPEDALLLGAGNGRKDAYSGRTIALGGHRLLYHHHYGDRPTWGTPKLVDCDASGELFARYWPGIAGLEKCNVHEGVQGALHVCREIGCGDWRRQEDRLVGEGGIRDTAVLLDPIWNDFHLSCTLEFDTKARVGVIVRRDPQASDQTKLGTIVGLDAGAGVLEWGALGFSDVNLVEDSARWSGPQGGLVRVRILCRGEFMEVYVDDRCVFSAYLGSLPRQGRMGFTVQGGRVICRDLRLAELEPLV